MISNTSKRAQNRVTITARSNKSARSYQLAYDHDPESAYRLLCEFVDESLRLRRVGNRSLTQHSHLQMQNFASAITRASVDKFGKRWEQATHS